MADLIYTDTNRKDKGVLQKYTLDLDVAEGKDFQLKAAEHILDIGCYWYITGTEYGGIVDSFLADEDNHVVTYEGRNYRGMLANKVIEPPKGYDYYIADGNLQTVLNELFAACICSDMFIADETDFEVHSFQFDRYTDLYSGITKMVESYSYNLEYVYSDQDSKVHVKAVLAADYSEYLDYCKDNSIKFTVGSTAGKCNHLVCLGRGDLAERKVIHLFTDENGGVQPYALKDIPLQDSDYILDKRNQLLIGLDEKVQVYDYPNAEVVTNYISLTSQPSNWAKTYTDYYIAEGESYKLNEVTMGDVYNLLSSQPSDWVAKYSNYYTKSGSTYNPVSFTPTDVYTLLTSQPSNWASKYGDYYVKSGSTYNSVDSIENEKYTKLTKKPKDWEKKWTDYYYYYSDGVSSEYRTAESLSTEKYKLQTRRPTDWDSNFKGYYMKKVIFEDIKSTSGTSFRALVSKTVWAEVDYVVINDRPQKGASRMGAIIRYKPIWKKNKYYTKITNEKAPKFKAGYYYKKKVNTIAPTWKASTYYSKSTTTYPSWAANTYYRKDEVEIIPKFVSGMYYQQVEDNFVGLVASGIDKLAELTSTNSQTVDLDDFDCIIGDTVGGTDDFTGLTITEKVTNMIVKSENGHITIEYKIGGN